LNDVKDEMGMNNPLHAAHYADRCLCDTVTVLANEMIACDTYRLRFSAPEMASRFLPGQFLMLRLTSCDDPLIGRPLALYDCVTDETGNPAAIDVVYLVAGKLTSRLARLMPGQELSVWGPLGNGFIPRKCDKLVMVAGGIGQTPFLALAKEVLGRQQYGSPARFVAPVDTVVFCYGARTADALAGVDDFRELGIDVRLATDDGTVGHHGYVSDVLDDVLAERSVSDRVHVVCCGPEPMMEAVARVTLAADVSCEVSLEEPMACGIGICFACVARIRTHDGQWDYQRTCVEGPVYDARQVVWHDVND
jgi:dihydroorotate dehydrogenase electron transfer subunit